MRARSPQTELRQVKAERNLLKRQVEVLKQELAQRRQVGGMMANICFNLAQNEQYDAQHRQSMKDCRAMWDAIKWA